MYGDQNEMQLKQQAESNAKCAQGQVGGVGAALGGYRTVGLTDEPCRVGIRERVENDLNRAARETRKLEQLHELSFLLQKNPDVARILDLVELVRG